MAYEDTAAADGAGWHPIHVILAAFPIAFFVGAFVTDVVYWRTAEGMWETFSVWLIAAGAAMGVLAAIAGIVDFALHRRMRASRPTWPHGLGNAVALALAVINGFVHSRDGYTAVVPTGLILSFVVSLIVLVTAWMGADIVYRTRAGGIN